jgi:hypothetical protein
MSPLLFLRNLGGLKEVLYVLVQIKGMPFILLEISIKATGRMVKGMAKENPFFWMVL